MNKLSSKVSEKSSEPKSAKDSVAPSRSLQAMSASAPCYPPSASEAQGAVAWPLSARQSGPALPLVGAELLTAQWEARARQCDETADQFECIKAFISSYREKARAYRSCIEDLQRHLAAQDAAPAAGRQAQSELPNDSEEASVRADNAALTDPAAKPKQTQ